MTDHTLSKFRAHKPNIDFGLRLRDCRRRANLRQQDVARRSGIGWRSISAWESGRAIGSLKVVQLVRLLDALDVPPAMFFAEDWGEWW